MHRQAYGCFLVSWFAMLCLAGCATPRASTALDREASARLADQVVVYSSEMLEPLEYEWIDRISATSCQQWPWDREPSKTDALDRLRQEAIISNGNGIANLLCEGEHGWAVSGCWASITCDGFAVRVIHEK